MGINLSHLLRSSLNKSSQTGIALVPVMVGVLIIGVVLSFVPLWVNNSTESDEQARLKETYRKAVMVTKKEIVQLKKAVLENRLELSRVEYMTTQDWNATIASELGGGMATVDRAGAELEAAETGEVSLVKSGSIEGGDYAVTVFLRVRGRSGAQSADKTILRWAN